tara:strand:- start:35 stop:190 length:156 start_codon:yes stop_codon:yes gene_type:complete
MYLSVGQVILLCLVFFMFFGNFEKLTGMFNDFKTKYYKKNDKKDNNKNLEE